MGEGIPPDDAPVMLGKLGTLAEGIDISEGGSSIAPKPPDGSTAAVIVFCSMPVAVIVLPPKLRSEPAGPDLAPLAPDDG